MVLKTQKAVFCTAIALVGFWAVHWWSAPAMHLAQELDYLTVDVQTLGEYPTSINRIRLSDMDKSAVIWEITAANHAAAQIHSFILKVGQNPTQLDAAAGSYRVMVPHLTDWFFLNRGTTYSLELWGEGSIFSKTSTSFRW